MTGKIQSQEISSHLAHKDNFNKISNQIALSLPKLSVKPLPSGGGV